MPLPQLMLIIGALERAVSCDVASLTDLATTQHDSAFVSNYFTRLAISKLLSIMEFIYLITDS